MSAKEKFYKLVGKTPDDLTQEDFDDIGPLLQLMPTHAIANYLDVPDWKVAAVEFELKEQGAL